MLVNQISDRLNVNEHLKEVRYAAREVRAKWNDLGIELEIEEGTRKVYRLAHCQECSGYNLRFPFDIFSTCLSLYYSIKL